MRARGSLPGGPAATLLEASFLRRRQRYAAARQGFNEDLTGRRHLKPEMADPCHRETTEPRSLASLREKRMKIGVKLASHRRTVIFAVAEIAAATKSFGKKFRG